MRWRITKGKAKAMPEQRNRGTGVISAGDPASLNIRYYAWRVARPPLRELFLIGGVRRQCIAPREWLLCVNRQSACPKKSHAYADRRTRQAVEDTQDHRRSAPYKPDRKFRLGWLVILRRSSVYHLRNFRLSFGHCIENLMNLCSNCFAFGQQKIDLLSQLKRITARSSPQGRELPFEIFLLLT